MGAVVEQIQQTYDLQVNGYYSQLHLLEDSLIQEDGRSLGLDINKKFFEAWQKESESTLIFLQENGKAITTDGTKLRVDMPSKLLLDLRNGYNIGKLVSLDYNQKKKDGYLVAIPCQEYTINGETYTAIGTLYDHSKFTYKLKLNGGDIKAVQGDSGHAQVNMVTDVYSHILDDDRRKNAELFEEAFYEKKNLDPQMHVQQENNNTTVADEVDPELLAKVLANPEMRALLNSLAKTMK